MAGKQVFLAKNKDGKPFIAQNKALKELMLSFGDNPYQIIIEKRVKKRSNQQNRFYHGCLIPSVIDALVDNGYARSELSHEIVHEYLKGKFLKKDIVSDQGEVLTLAESTANLSTEQFNLFIDDIARWGAEFLNTTFLMPNEQSELAI